MARNNQYWALGLDPENADEILKEHNAAAAALGEEMEMDVDGQPESPGGAFTQGAVAADGSGGGGDSDSAAAATDNDQFLEVMADTSHPQDEAPNKTLRLLAYAAHLRDRKYWSRAEVPLGDEPLSFDDTLLGRMPPEILELIFLHLFGAGMTIDVTIPHAKHGAAQVRFLGWFPEFRSAYAKVLMSCKAIYDAGLSHLSKDTKFVSRYADSAKHLPAIFGKGCEMVQDLQIYIDFKTKVLHERMFPMLLRMLEVDMPNLNRFSLRSRYLSGSAEFPSDESGDPDGSVTRDQQELRSIVRFGAFLTLRHPRLKAMVLLATSGPSYEPNNGYIEPFVELYAPDVPRKTRLRTKRTRSGSSETRMCKDIILDSAHIRRIPWTDLAVRVQEPRELALNSELVDLTRPGWGQKRHIIDGSYITSSEINAPKRDNPYYVVDQRGYLPFFVLKEKGLWVEDDFRTVDQLISDVHRLEDDMLEALCGDHDDVMKRCWRHEEGRDVMVPVSDAEGNRMAQAAEHLERRWFSKWAQRERKPLRGGRGGGVGNAHNRSPYDPSQGGRVRGAGGRGTHGGFGGRGRGA